MFHLRVTEDYSKRIARGKTMIFVVSTVQSVIVYPRNADGTALEQLQTYAGKFTLTIDP